MRVVVLSETAERLASGSIPVFGTPALVALMEAAAMETLSGHLPAGKTSVGAGIDVRHLAATPVGMKVCARAELVEVDGRRLVFSVTARDEVETIGEAIHTRFIMDEALFVAKTDAKRLA